MKLGILLSLATIAIPVTGHCACRVSDADVTISRFYDIQNLHMYWGVVGELVNNCKEPIGIQVRFVGRGKSGELIDVKETWPASIRNIPANSRSPFKTEAFAYNKDIKTLTAEVIEVKQWRQ